MKDQEFSQPIEGLVADGSQPAAVQIQLLNPLAANECLTLKDSSEVVPIKVYCSCIHWEQVRDFNMATVGALDDVG